MLTITNLTVTHPDHTKAVDGLGLQVGDGENVAVMGANGAGKTSLFLSLVGALPIEGGTVCVDGVELNKKTRNEIRRRIGLVFQNPNDQLFTPSIWEDVAFGPRNYGIAEEETAARVTGALEKLNISHLAPRSSLKLSMGEKRAAAIATVMVMEPSVLLLDEPTAFLDPKSKRALVVVLDALPQTKLIATHDVEFAKTVCERVVLMKGGRIVADGRMETILGERALMEECGLR